MLLALVHCKLNAPPSLHSHYFLKKRHHNYIWPHGLDSPEAMLPPKHHLSPRLTTFLFGYRPVGWCNWQWLIIFALQGNVITALIWHLCRPFSLNIAAWPAVFWLLWRDCKLQSAAVVQTDSQSGPTETMWHAVENNFLFSCRIMVP